MTRREKPVDQHVYSLAAFWLSDDDSVTNKKVHDRRVQSLAADIQTAIEDWIEDEQRQAAEDEARDEELRSLRGYDPQDVAENF